MTYDSCCLYFPSSRYNLLQASSGTKKHYAILRNDIWLIWPFIYSLFKMQLFYDYINQASHEPDIIVAHALKVPTALSSCCTLKITLSDLSSAWICHFSSLDGCPEGNIRLSGHWSLVTGIWSRLLELDEHPGAVLGVQKHDRLAVSSDLGLVLEASGGNPIEHSYSSVERVIYREVQQDFTTEIDVLCLTDGILIIERGLINSI